MSPRNRNLLNAKKIDPKKLGRLGEKAARFFLEGKGYKFVEANFRCHYGEIDLIMKDPGSKQLGPARQAEKSTIVIVEVKTRFGVRGWSRFGVPEESITSGKKRKLSFLTEYYLRTRSFEDRDFRVDIVAINYSIAQRRLVFRHLKAAI